MVTLIFLKGCVRFVLNKHLRDMECTVHDLEVMSSNPGQVEHLGCVGLLVKSNLNDLARLTSI